MHYWHWYLNGWKIVKLVIVWIKGHTGDNDSALSVKGKISHKKKKKTNCENDELGSTGRFLPVSPSAAFSDSHGIKWMSLAEILTLNLCEARDGPLAGLQHDTSSFISVTNSLIFVFSQELHILHEGVHVSHSGREWHGPLLQLQNEVLWEGRTKQEQRHHLPGHWGLYTAGSGAWHCVVQGKLFPFYLLFAQNSPFWIHLFFLNEELRDVK